MSRNEDNLNGAMTGIAIAAAAHWARYDDDTQRRLRNVRLDAEEALDLIRDMQSRGEVVRSRLPTVMDAQVGISIASPQPTAASVVPSTTPLVRPDLSTQMETAVADMTWPPEPGQYDDRGLVKQAGELTPMFLSLTYEEVRAFVQGLSQSRPPSRDCKVQIYYAANALVAQLCGQKLTWQQYKDAWARLFGGATGIATTTDPHIDPARPPSVGALGAGVGTVVPLTSLPGGIPGYPYANRNTDKAMRFRITTNGAVGAGNAIVTVSFNSEFRDENGPFQPVVLVNGDLPFYAVSVTSLSFVLKSTQGLANAQTYDFFAATFRPNGC
jgi:hypothetical protein